MTGDPGFIAETFEEMRESGVAHCQLCPEDDDEVDVSDVESIGEVLDRMAEHGIEHHDLPADEPWTDRMLEEAAED